MWKHKIRVKIKLSPFFFLKKKKAVQELAGECLEQVLLSVCHVVLPCQVKTVDLYPCFYPSDSSVGLKMLVCPKRVAQARLSLVSARAWVSLRSFLCPKPKNSWSLRCRAVFVPPHSC